MTFEVSQPEHKYPLTANHNCPKPKYENICEEL